MRPNLTRVDADFVYELELNIKGAAFLVGTLTPDGMHDAARTPSTTELESARLLLQRAIYSIEGLRAQLPKPRPVGDSEILNAGSARRLDLSR